MWPALLSTVVAPFVVVVVVVVLVVIVVVIVVVVVVVVLGLRVSCYPVHSTSPYRLHCLSE